VRLLPRPVLASLALAALAASVRADGEPILDDVTYEKVRDAVLPTAQEERWREVPWRASVWDAVVEAAQADRPVLVWAMNGHPLGCT
jgi:hypothetical protein